MKDLILGNDKHLQLNVKPIKVVNAQLAFQAIYFSCSAV